MEISETDELDVFDRWAISVYEKDFGGSGLRGDEKAKMKTFYEKSPHVRMAAYELVKKRLYVRVLKEFAIQNKRPPVRFPLKIAGWPPDKESMQHNEKYAALLNTYGLQSLLYLDQDKTLAGVLSEKIKNLDEGTMRTLSEYLLLPLF